MSYAHVVSTHVGMFVFVLQISIKRPITPWLFHTQLYSLTFLILPSKYWMPLAVGWVSGLPSAKVGPFNIDPEKKEHAKVYTKYESKAC